MAVNRSSRSLSPVLAALCLASTAMAQESRSPFEAATIQFPDSVSIVRTGDFNDDGVVDGVAREVGLEVVAGAAAEDAKVFAAGGLA